MTSNFLFRHPLFSPCLIILLTWLSPIYAQQKPTYNLLWEIRGNGLDQPSYLFGSIQIKDRRAYNFSDSVYKAIAATRFFAMENHPDSLVKMAINKQKEISIPTAGAQDDPPKMSATADERPGYAGTYLYGLARTFKKRIYGLSDQHVATEASEEADIEEMDEAEEEERLAAMDELMAAYKTGNMDEIQKVIVYYATDDQFADRAASQTTAIVNLLKTGNAFIVTGVALMPGEQGIIALLKKAGYQLRPVTASFDLPEQANQIDYTKMDWYTYQDQTYHYQVNFPSAPFQSNSTGRSKIKTYTDPINNVTYTASALYTGPLQNMSTTAYVDTALANYISKYKAELTNSSRQEKYGTTLLATEMEVQGKFMRSVLMHTNGTFYTFSVESTSNILHQPFAELFFESIVIKSPQAIKSTDWVHYQNKPGAFSLRLPTLPEEIAQEIPYGTSSYKVNIYTVADKANEINYVFRYNDFPIGVYLADKNAVFDATIKELKGKGELIGQVRTIYKDGYEGRALDMALAGSFAEIQLYLRGNRTYLLLRQNMKEMAKPKNDQFLESFQFTPYQPGNNKLFTVGNIEVMMPENAIIAKEKENKGEDDDENDNRYTSFLNQEETRHGLNTNSGGIYNVERNEIANYYKTKNIDSICGLIIKGLSANNVAPLSTTDVAIGHLTGKEFTITDSLSGIQKRMRTWLDGNQFYFQAVYGTQEELESEQAKQFFTSVKFKTVQEPFDFKAPKSKLIVKGLASNDTTTYLKALGALSYYDFGLDELPSIYEALQPKYTDDTSKTGARYKLITELGNINDAQSSDFLKKLYQDNQDRTLIKSAILSVITIIDKNNYDWYFNNLTNGPTFELENNWPLFKPLSDSLAYASKHIDDILKLINVQTYRPMVLDLVSSLLVEGETNQQTLLQTKKEAIGKHAMADLDIDAERLSKNEYALTLYSYLAILPQLMLPHLTDDFTKKVIALDSVPYLRTRAVEARLLANLPVDQQLLYAQLDSLSSRYTMMRTYKKLGKLETLPLKYRKHDEFAKLLLHNYLEDEYDITPNLKLLGTVKEGEETYYVFDFTTDVNGVEVTYLGISGPFNDKSADLDFEAYHSHVNFETKSKDWSKQAKTLIAELKDNL